MDKDKKFVVSTLSIIYLFNSQTKSMGKMYIGRDSYKNILNLLNLTIYIATFPLLIRNELNGGLAFRLSTNKKSINCRKQHIPFFIDCVHQININNYHDYSEYRKKRQNFM